MFVKPAPGRLVRWPGNHIVLPDEGSEVPNDFWWHRRLTQGDVVEVKKDQQAEAAVPQQAVAHEQAEVEHNAADDHEEDN